MVKILKKNTDNAEKAPVVSIEKKIWIWLSKYSGYLGKLCALLLTIAVLWILHCKWCSYREKKAIAAYAIQTTLQGRVAWAESNQPCGLNNLKGFIFLENANTLIEQKRFDEALVYFEKSLKLLKLSPIKEQALAGFGFVQIQLQKWTEAEKLFLELYKCNFKYLRAQALYALCYIADQKGDTKGYETYREKLQSYDEGGALLNRLDVIKSAN